MKILIAADIEGVANVWRPEQTVAGSPDYESARRWLTAEVSAAARGAFTAGATEVRVADSHGHYANILADALDPRVRLIQGKPRRLGMLAGVEGVDGVLLIGWHARSRSAGALAHSINSFAFSRIWLNDREVGEIGLYLALAAECGAPVLMLSGCEQAVAEAQAFLPQLAGAVVKWPQGARAGCSLSGEAAQRLIEETAERVCRDMASIVEYELPPQLRTRPVRMRLQCQSAALADLFALWPTLRREDAADTLDFECPDVQEAVRSLNALSTMSAALR